MLLLFIAISLLNIKNVLCEANQNCESKENCDACIQDINCAWCTNLVPSTKKQSHCRSKLESSLCSSATEPPETGKEILQDSQFSDTSDKPVQIKPQNVKVQLRKGEKYELKFQYKMTENYPVDLYFLMDLSYSMALHRDNLARLGDELAMTIKRLTTNLTLGFGSFIDKVELPYSTISESDFKKSCKGCERSYSFKNLLSLTSNTKKFVKAVNESRVSGNIDSPEGGLDAILQSILCKEIQWRDQAMHLLVYSTDASFHVAGDGKLGGIVEPNPARCYTDVREYIMYDYPSISQINYIARQNKINVIFAIVDNNDPDLVKVYDEFSQQLENSNFGLLSNHDSRNVLDLVVNNYKKIVQEIVFTSDAPKEVDVKFFSNCQHSTVPGGCADVHVGDILQFTATIEARECLPSGKQTIKIFPKTINQMLTVELETICECSCSNKNSTSFQKSSTKCNSQGDLICGVCTCDPGRFGKYCQCDSNYSQTENTTNCIPPESTEICSGLGNCICGKCECFPRQNEGENIYGKWCQCNNFSCKKGNDLLCSGRGKCNCMKCECRAGYSGDACQCEENPDKCYAPGSNVTCSGHGTCVCGKCDCTMNEKRYFGKYCEDCATCSAQRCDEFRNCAICRIHKTGEYNETMCNKMCNYTINGVDKLDDADHKIKKCQVSDNDKCIIIYEYEYLDANNVVVNVQKEKLCPKPVNILAWIAGVIGSVLLVGLITLLIWKIITTIHDRREFAKFEENTKNLKWAKNEINPLYREAKTTFENPLFHRLSRRFSINKKK